MRDPSASARSEQQDWSGLRATATAVLEENWIGASTKPSARLYPHQWSWDSAFIAIGNAAQGNTERAVLELQTLFAAQWSNGMIPHMVFDQSATDYHPSPEVWGTRGVAAMPADLLTSGMCQPPVHALAVRRVADALEAGPRRNFLVAMFPALVRWHDYLHQTRAVGSPLLELWHPWESGMDNSPLWDTALARIDPAPNEVPDYQRVDTDHAAADERPTTTDYDRYMWIVGVMRDQGWEPEDPTTLPFRSCDVLFNALAADADTHLAAIAEAIGQPGQRFIERAARLTAAIEAEMWSDDLGMYLNVDRIDGSHVPARCAGGLMPLLLDLRMDRRERLTVTLHEQFITKVPARPHGWTIHQGPLTADGATDSAAARDTVRNVDSRAMVVPSMAPGDDAHDPARYWRGPVWVNITWLLIQALEALDSVEEPKPIDPVEESSPIVSVEEPSPIVSVEEPSLIVSVEESGPIVSVEESGPIVSVEEPSLIVSVEESGPIVSVEESGPIVSAEEPSLIVSVEESSPIVSAEEPKPIDPGATASALAEQLRHGVLDLVATSGCNEYFHAQTGAPLGADTFSWTAALVLDLAVK